MSERGNYWPNNVPMPVAPPQPSPPPDLFIAGCICPIGANLACENPLCPRKSVLRLVAESPRR
jgi:hypothetical protein